MLPFESPLPACPVRARALPAIDYFDPVFKADAHRAYAALRRHAPVHRITQRDGRALWLVTRHADVCQVLRDPRFVKNRRSALTPAEVAMEPPLPGPMRYLASHLLSVDPPQHTRLRRLVQRAFAPRLVEAMRPRVQAIADRLLDACATGRTIELIDDYAAPLPIAVITELLGIPTQDHVLFRGWSQVLVTHAAALDESAVGMLVPVLEAFATYLRELLAHKRRHPGSDLTTRLVQARDHGELDDARPALDEDELISMLLLLIVAGHETTTHLIGNGMLTLLQHPESLARLRDDPGLMPRAIDELLRYDGPVETSTLRYARVDMTLGGAKLARGDLVMAVLASANRDESVYPDADRLDFGRDDDGHLALGHGIHFCVGAALARLEAAVAIGTLLRRAAGLRLDVDAAALQWRVGPLMRGLEALPLRFDAMATATAESSSRTAAVAPVNAPASPAHVPPEVPLAGNPKALWFWAV